MLEESVIQRVLGAALRTGGDFAEIFVEDKRSSSARLDDGNRSSAYIGKLHPRQIALKIPQSKEPIDALARAYFQRTRDRESHFR